MDFMVKKSQTGGVYGKVTEGVYGEEVTDREGAYGLKKVTGGVYGEEVADRWGLWSKSLRQVGFMVNKSQTGGVYG